MNLISKEVKELCKDMIDNPNEPNLKYLTKVIKQPLFKSEDGVDVFEGDSWFTVKKHNFSIFEGNIVTLDLRDSNNIRFSTKQAAENYVICNKQCLSLTEILDTYAIVAPRNSPLYNKFKIKLVDLINSKL